MAKFMKIMMGIVISAGLLVGCGRSDAAQYTVGIVQFAEHGSLDNCREGFIQGLADEGFVDGENIEIVYHNAQADMGAVNQIVSSLVSDQVDLIATIATPAAQAAYNVAGETAIPIIYTAVTDPVAAELATEGQNPTGNITGTSDELPVDTQLQRIRQLLPDAKKLGILYTTSEASSYSSIKKYQELAPKYDFELITESVTQTADIPLATDSLLSQVDCLTNILDNTVVSSLPIILDKAADKGIPVFGSEIEQVRRGCLAAEGIDYIQLGQQTGRMASQVLKGEKQAIEMPYELISEASFYINRQVAEDLGLTIDESVYDEATEVFDTIESGS